VARVAAKLQRGVGLGKGASHKALRAHVFQKPGQAVVARAWAARFIDPVAATRHGHQLRKQADLPGRVYLHDLNGTAHARHGTRQQVTLRPGRTHFAHLARSGELGQGPRYGGLAGAKLGLKLCAAQVWLSAQGLHNQGSKVGQSSHE
jgi:hypothetical protein